GRKRHELRGHAERTPNHFPSMLHACVFSADGKYLATGDKLGKVVVWEAATGKQAGAVEAPTLYTWDPTQRHHSIGGVRALAFSADGKWLAAGGVGQINNIDALAGPARVEVFEWTKGSRLFEVQQGSGCVNALIFHPKGEGLAAAGGGNDFFSSLAP